ADHPLDHLRFVTVDSTQIAEGGHGATEAIGFVRREAGSDDGDLHRLFLEQGNAEGSAEHFLQLVRRMRRPGRWEIDLLLPVAAAEIRMDHVALDWARAD